MTVWVIVGVVNGYLNSREEEDRRRNLGRLGIRKRKKREKKRRKN